jgi:hypothetical protein
VDARSPERTHPIALCQSDASYQIRPEPSSTEMRQCPLPTLARVPSTREPFSGTDLNEGCPTPTSALEMF